MLRSITITIILGITALHLSGIAQAADIEIVDDTGRVISLSAPAKRVVTLTPHATEMVYAAGGGEKIVATVTASDFPDQARRLARIGDGLQIDPERVAAFKPDLVIGWLPDQADALDALNIPVFMSAPRSLEDIADNIESLGVLLGTSPTAQISANAIRTSLNALQHKKTGGQPVRVFIQAGEEPEYSLGGDHILSTIITRCGGINIFQNAAALAPKISIESVLAGKPDLVIVGRSNIAQSPSVDEAALVFWKKKGLDAAKNKQVFMIDASILYRPGPRLIDAANQMCELIQTASKH